MLGVRLGLKDPTALRNEVVSRTTVLPSLQDTVDKCITYHGIFLRSFSGSLQERVDWLSQVEQHSQQLPCSIPVQASATKAYHGSGHPDDPRTLID